MSAASRAVSFKQQQQIRGIQIGESYLEFGLAVRRPSRVATLRL